MARSGDLLYNKSATKSGGVMKSKIIFIMMLFGGMALGNSAYANSIPFTCINPQSCGAILYVSSGLGSHQVMKLKSADKAPPLWFVELPLILPPPTQHGHFNTVRSQVRFDGTIPSNAQVVYDIEEEGHLRGRCAFVFSTNKVGENYNLLSAGSCSIGNFTTNIIVNRSEPSLTIRITQ